MSKRVPSAISEYMAKLGKKGGKVSGAKRMEMPEEQRREIARKAAQARWKRRKKQSSNAIS
jgi:hypothetical protein